MKIQNKKYAIAIAVVGTILLIATLAALFSNPIILASIAGVVLACLIIGFFSKRYNKKFDPSYSISSNFQQNDPEKFTIVLTPVEKEFSKIFDTNEFTMRVEKNTNQKVEFTPAEKKQIKTAEIEIDLLNNQNERTKTEVGLPVPPSLIDLISEILNTQSKDDDILKDFTSRTDKFTQIKKEKSVSYIYKLPQKIKDNNKQRKMDSMEIPRRVFQHISAGNWGEFLYNRIQQSFFCQAGIMQSIFNFKIDSLVINTDNQFLEFVTGPNKPNDCVINHCFMLKKNPELSNPFIDESINIKFSFKITMNNNICTVTSAEVFFLSGYNQDILDNTDGFTKSVKSFILQHFESSMNDYVKDQKERIKNSKNTLGLNQT